MIDIVYTIGVYDLLHRGHIEHLKYCKFLGDFLVVGIMGDEIAFQQKGESPIQNEKDRAFAVESLKYVDKVYIYTDFNYLKHFKLTKANIFCITDECKDDKRFNDLRKYIKLIGGDIYYDDYRSDYSSTSLKEKIYEIYKEKNNHGNTSNSV